MTSLADIEIFMSEVHKDCKRCPVRFECNENDFVDFDCEDVLEHMKRENPKGEEEKMKRNQIAIIATIVMALLRSVMFAESR